MIENLSILDATKPALRHICLSEEIEDVCYDRNPEAMRCIQLSFSGGEGASGDVATVDVATVDVASEGPPERSVAPV